MSPIEPVEIILDKPRKLLINHFTLYRAEAEVNRLRYAKPEEYASIDVMMVEGFNHIFKSLGMLPMDLMLAMLCHGLVYEDPKEKRLNIEQVAGLLDLPEVDRQVVSTAIWAAYFKVAGKNIKIVGPEDTEKKTDLSDPPTGLESGPLPGSTLN